jgi:hypothetical protein
MTSRFTVLIWSALLLAAVGCATQRVPQGSTPVVQASGEIPQDMLLEIGIEVFDPGLPEQGEEMEEEDLVFAGVRQAEARFIPYQLKNTLQQTGQWGAVRLVPDDTRSVEVEVVGEILSSDGEKLRVRISVVDATGRSWLDEEYEGKVDANSYIVAPGDERDPFQDLYNRIANDMLAVRNVLQRDDIQEIRSVATLRFASDLAPHSFGDDLTVTPEGRTVLRRLPAEDDPMLARVEKIRQRDDLFIDTLNEHYADFYMGMDDAYLKWRAYSYEEVTALRKIKRQARLRLVGGAVAIIGGLALATVGAPVPIEILAGPLIAGGTLAARSGWELTTETQIHAEAVRELGRSFESDVAPQVVEVEGQTLRLTGSAETQYQEWRRLLRDIYISETGFTPLDTLEETSGSAGATE